MIKLVAVLLVTLLVGCAAKPIITIAQQPENSAWWLRATFHPHGESLRGIPVKTINPQWCAIDELEKGLFPNPIEANSSDWEPTSNSAVYSTDGLQINGGASILVLAIFSKCTGGTGTAMVLMQQGHGTRPDVISALTIASPASWATVELISSDSVRIAWCFECDSFVDFKWNPTTNRFNEVSSDDEEFGGAAPNNSFKPKPLRGSA